MIDRAAGRTVTHDIRNSRRLRPEKGASESAESFGVRARRRLLSWWNKRRRGEGEWTLVEAVQGQQDGTHHPLIARCPTSGEEHFRVGDHAWDVSGLTTEHAASLLDDIHTALEQSGSVVCLDWTAGDLIVFDNRVVLHRRVTSGFGDPGRELRRVLVVPAGPT